MAVNDDDSWDGPTRVDVPSSQDLVTTLPTIPRCQICGAIVWIVQVWEELHVLPDRCARSGDGRWYWCWDIGLVGLYTRR